MPNNFKGCNLTKKITVKNWNQVIFRCGTKVEGILVMLIEDSKLFKVFFRPFLFPSLEFFGLANWGSVRLIEDLNCRFRFRTTFSMLLFSPGVWNFVVVLLVICIHQRLVPCWRLWCLMSLHCGEFQTLFEFGPLVWSLGDEPIVFRSSLEGAMVHPFAFYFSSSVLTGCLRCSLVASIMDPCQRIVSWRGSIGNVGVKRSRCFAFDTVGTFFDFVPLDVRKEIPVLESQESGDRPYHYDPQIIGDGLKCVPNCVQTWVYLGREDSISLHSLSMHQKMNTLLHLIL